MNAALRPAIITLCLVALSACGKESATPAEASQPSAEAASAPAPSLPRTPAPEGARAFIVSPADGATVEISSDGHFWRREHRSRQGGCE